MGDQVLLSESSCSSAVIDPECLVGFQPKQVNREYVDQYPLLTEYGRSANTEDALIFLALAIYGWMPTILKTHRLLKAENENGMDGASRIFSPECAKEARDTDDPISFLNDLKAPILNNSWVGTSKFLHFLNVEAFPIWDSRIARAFGTVDKNGKPAFSRLNKKTMYMAYTKLIRKSEEAQKLAFDKLSHEVGYEMTKTRCLELILFTLSSNENFRVGILCPCEKTCHTSMK